MFKRDKGDSAVSFDAVLSQERSRLAAKREGIARPPNDASEGRRPREAGFNVRVAPPAEGLPAAEAPAVETPPARHEPVGLALSGGGIRSATFCLGVLQALAAKGRLEDFDYLSTVSGGGYIGGWLSAWIHRTNLTHVAQELAHNAATGAQEPKQVQWLRRYSNYLTPRAGLFSLDALTVTATWLRNVLLNLIVLVSFIAFVLLVPIAIFYPATRWLSAHAEVAMWAALAAGLACMSCASINLTWKCRSKNGDSALLLTPMGVTLGVIVPGFVAAGLASCWLFFSTFDGSEWPRYLLDSAAAFILVVGLAWCAGWYASKRCERRSAQDATKTTPAAKAGSAPRASAEPVDESARAAAAKERSEQRRRLLETLAIYLFATAIAFGVGAGLLRIAWHVLHEPDLRIGEAGFDTKLVNVITWGPPTIMLCFGISVSIWIGIAGRSFTEPMREWWSRAGGLFIMTSVGCFAWFALAFFVPLWVRCLLASGFGWWHALISSTWFGSLVGALLLALHQEPNKAARGPNWRAPVASVLTTLFAAGLIVLIACGLHAALDAIALAFGGEIDDYGMNYFARLAAWWQGRLPTSTLALLGALAITVVFAWRVDINRFSLHNMYKNRIIRCYLGASNDERNAQPFTGFDESDDIPLKDLYDEATQQVQRPSHIINTAMNLVQGSELAWQQRKAASFVLTPNYCGFAMSRAQGDQHLAADPAQLPGFQPTNRYARKDPQREECGFSLGMAVATSGAALSPNMGANTQPGLAALLTFFNIRLGRWSPNPAGDRWEQSSPTFGLAWLLAELFGYTNERRDFVYLSDGGHFENMGVYELVRRRCRRIVAVDAGADPQRTFEDIGNMLRKCRVDHDTEIVLDDFDQLFACDDSGRCKRGFITGKIHYPKDANGVAHPEGEILIIKPSLYQPPKEAADLYNYASATQFPQESTVDQWFDESQFESYRSLGYALCRDALEAHENFFAGSAAAQPKTGAKPP